MIRTIYHRHKGVTSNGKLKSHPVTVKHKDINAQRHHNLITEKMPITNTKCANAKKATTTIDDAGYIRVDLRTTPKEVKGVRIQFERTENNKKRLIGLQIEK